MTAFHDILRARQQQQQQPQQRPAAAVAAAPSAGRPVAAPWRPMRQKQAARWAVHAPAGQALGGPQHRAMRLVLEALELARTAGLSEAQMQTVVSATFSRDPGPPARSAGGVGVALLMLCDALGVDAEASEVSELNRVLALGEAPPPNRRAASPQPAAADAGTMDRELRPGAAARPAGGRRATADAGSA